MRRKRTSLMINSLSLSLLLTELCCTTRQGLHYLVLRDMVRRYKSIDAASIAGVRHYLSMYRRTLRGAILEEYSENARDPGYKLTMLPVHYMVTNWEWMSSAVHNAIASTTSL